MGCEPAAVSPHAQGEPKPGVADVPDLAFLRITHVNVGQGDATLIEGPERVLLVDAGDNGMGDDRVVRVLQEYGISVLDWVVASHPHADHIGGLDEVLDRATVPGGVWDNGESRDTQAFARYADAAEASVGGRHTIQPGHVFELGDGVRVTCYAVNGLLLDGWQVYGATETNDRSVVLVVEWGSFRYVLAGDLGGYDVDGIADVETSLAGLIGDVDVIRVSHHGSRYSTNPTWLNTLKAEVAVISVGDGNPYGHPAAPLLDRLTGADTDVTVPPPDIWLTEKGVAPAPYSGAGDVVIEARPGWYEVEHVRYDAVAR